MPRAVSISRDPSKVRAGRIGARSRWGTPRRVHIGDLPPARRAVVLALIEAERRAQERESGGAA